MVRGVEKMRIELSRDDVEEILKKYMSMDTVVLNEDGTATVDTTLEKLVSDKTPQEELFNPIYFNPLKQLLNKVEGK